MARDKVLVERGLSNTQAQQLSLELSGRGVAVECTLSALAGWDVWVYGSTGGGRPEADVRAAGDAAD